MTGLLGLNYNEHFVWVEKEFFLAIFDDFLKPKITTVNVTFHQTITPKLKYLLNHKKRCLS